MLLSTNEIKNTTIAQLNVFPNPSSNIINVIIENYKPTSAASIKVYDMQGKEVKHIASVNSENTISIEDLAPGQYILNLIDRNKKVANKTFVVE